VGGWAADTTDVKRALILGLTFVAALAASQATAGAAGLSLQSQSFQMSGADDKDRLTVQCPGSTLPYSGGMVGDPIAADGQGVYPHSFERLGVQRGWHVTSVVFGLPLAGNVLSSVLSNVLGTLTSPASPPPTASASHAVTLQVVCGPRLGPVSSPHSTLFVRPGESQTAVATCPRGNRIFAGGFQRTNFVSDGGAYVTASRALDDRSWQVSGSAFGRFGGELTAIAYCLRSRGPLVSDVSAQSPVPPLNSATATTPGCPPGSSLVAGGFEASPSGPAMVASAYFNPAGGWSATAFNWFGPAATLTSHGYCLSGATIKRLARMRHGTRGPGERSVRAPAALDAALKVAIAERVSLNGCYPGPADLVDKLHANGISAQLASNPRAADRPGVVYVLSAGASCERVRLAMRRGKAVIVLDSASGEVRLQQHR
jgi:hypothetical protein